MSITGTNIDTLKQEELRIWKIATGKIDGVKSELITKADDIKISSGSKTNNKIKNNSTAIYKKAMQRDRAYAVKGRKFLLCQALTNRQVSVFGRAKLWRKLERYD